MTHRSDRIHLPANEPRCVPENECKQKGSCARYMAALPSFGGSMIGAGLPLSWYVGRYCPSFVAVRGGSQGTTTKPAAKPAIKGIA